MLDKNRFRKPRGFTVVELAVVIVVIGILATITIVSYRQYQDRTHDLAVSSDLLALNAEIVSFMNHNDRYPSNDDDMMALGFKATEESYNNTSTIAISYCTNYKHPSPSSTITPAFGIVSRSKSGAMFYTSSRVGAEVKEIDKPTAATWTASGAGAYCSNQTGVKRGDPVSFAYYESSTGSSYFTNGDWAGFQ